MKRVLVFIMCITVAICFAACGESKSVDDSFIEAEASGLQARWDLSDQHDKDKVEDNAENFIACVDAELNKVSEFKDSEFEDKTLGKLAKEYIDILEKSKDLASKYYDKNYKTFDKQYTPLNQRRSQIIQKFSEDYKMPIDKEHQSTLDEFIADAKLTSAVQEIINNAKFEKVSDEYGWKEYEAVLENTADQKFDYFVFNINLVDKDGVVVETQSASTDNWDVGEKHRFKFSTDAKFKKIEIDSAEY